MFLAGAASSLTAPNLRNVLSLDDYPRWALDQEAYAAALVDVSVDSTGVITNCRTISTIGSDRLGKELCKIVSRRHVTPARDTSGKPAPSRVSTMLTMFTWPPREDILKYEPSPDVVLIVQKLPRGNTTVNVDVVIEAEPSGVVSNCASAKTDANAPLVKAACGSLLGSTLDEKQAVRFVTTRKVQFKTEASPSQPPNNSAANPR